MVRIVDKTSHPSVVKQIICRNCECTLEYVPKDIKERRVSDYTGGHDTYYYIKCPECNHEVTVSKY